MVLNQSCNTASLNAFVPTSQNEWNEQKAKHLYRRVAYGATNTEITTALNSTPSSLVDSLVDNAISLPTTQAPVWANWIYNDYVNQGLDPLEANNLYTREWSQQMVKDLLSDGLRGRLTLFWHNHFVTELPVYRVCRYQFQYYNTIQNYCLGNFKEFVRAMGLTSAMLVYLNGYENTKNSPNENYARELYELFTLGVDNGYTQEDIEETSKALTGYNNRPGPFSFITFNSNRFNNDDKTIFGRTGNWNYDDVIDILFEEKGSLIANFICTKLYKYFVSPVVNESIVNQLATSFQQDFNIGNVLKVLFKSEHFFDSSTFASQIKSPYDLINNYLKTTDFTINDSIYNGIYSFNGVMGQELFNPVDVAGWQGDKDWINSSTLSGRWSGLQYLVNFTWYQNKEEFRNFAINASNNSNDPMVVTKSILHQFIPNDLNEESYYEVALEVFKADIPQNYFDDYSWNLNWDEAPLQVSLLLLFMVKMPEFQMK